MIAQAECRRTHVDDARDDDVEVGGIALPGRVAVGLQVRPLVVEVEREAGVAHAGTAAGGSTSGNARSASCTLSFTLRVPLTICAEPTKEEAGGSSFGSAAGDREYLQPSRSERPRERGRRRTAWTVTALGEEPGYIRRSAARKLARISPRRTAYRRAGRRGATYFGR